MGDMKVSSAMTPKDCLKAKHTQHIQPSKKERRYPEDKDAKWRHAGEQCDDEPQDVALAAIAAGLRCRVRIFTVHTIIGTELA